MSEETKLPDENADGGNSSQETTAETDKASGASGESGSAPVTEQVEQPPIPPRRHGVEVSKGIGLTVLLHLIPLIFPALYFGIGIVQLVYIIPAIIICRKNTGMVQGLLIGAGITFLLNAACFGLMSISFKNL